MSAPVRVTVWGENLHEQRNPAVQAHYPRGMHTTIAEAIREHLGERASVRTATFDQPEHVLTDDILAETDVLTWWGHVAHAQVDDSIVNQVHERTRHKAAWPLLDDRRSRGARSTRAHNSEEETRQVSIKITGTATTVPQALRRGEATSPSQAL